MITDNIGQKIIINEDICESEKLNEILIKTNNTYVYEVIRIIGAKPLFLLDHYERFMFSIKKQGHQFDKSYLEYYDLIKKLVVANGIVDGNIQVSYYLNDKFVLYYQKKHLYPSQKQYQQGVLVETVQIERHLPNVKLADPSFNKKIAKCRENSDAFELLLVNDVGYVTEGSKSNFFYLKDDICYTAADDSVLKGVTRKNIINAINNSGIIYQQKNSRVENVLNADAAFICGTSLNILPICQINKTRINSANNMILLSIMQEFEKIIKNSLEEALVE